MFGKRIPLFKIFGFQVGIDYSWFFLAVLITWSLAVGLFPALFKDLTPVAYWAMGVVGALGLFVSIVLHELSHSLVARRFGIEMKGITLFIFGGVAEMTAEPPSARAEFWVAVAGPIASFAIAAALLAAGVAAGGLGWPVEVTGVLGYLGVINAILAAFNLLPAFPLDGGRVLRSFLWYVRDDLSWATRVTSQIGSWFGVGFIVLGVASVLAGNLIGGLWWALIGMFLRGAARASYRQLIIRRELEGETVDRFMRKDPVTVPPDITVQQLVDDYVYRHYFKMYPVVEDGRLIGCITTGRIKGLPPEQWAARTVGEVAEVCSESNIVRADDDAMAALSKMNRTGASRLMVADNGRLVGVIALKDLLSFLSMKIELGKP
jgi:Zn-dependent protease